MENLVQEIVEDGVVDANEVQALREKFLADGVIDREEADALFAINDGVSGNDNHESWGDFFVEAISSHVLEDEETPGVIDEAEGDWLASKIEGDGQLDELEKRLLAHIEVEAKSIESSRLNALLATI